MRMKFRINFTSKSTSQLLNKQQVNATKADEMIANPSIGARVMVVDLNFGSNVAATYLSGYSCPAWWSPYNNQPKDENEVIFFQEGVDMSFEDKLKLKRNYFSEEAYEKARENLLQFAIVGITEEYAYSVFHLSQYFGSEILLESHKRQKFDKVEPTDFDLKIVNDLNYYDIKLYQLGLLLFKQQHDILLRFSSFNM